MRVLLAAPSSPSRLHSLVPFAWALRSAGHDVKIAGRPSFVEEILRTGCVAVDLEGGDEAELAESAALVEFAKLWRPEVVVSDAQAPAGTAAARAVAAVAVRLLGVLDEPDASEVDLALDVVPPSLRDPGSSATPVRHVPYFGPAVVPAWLRRKARRSRILLSLNEAAAFGPVFAAVSDVDAELVCAVEPSALPSDISLPANVKLVDAAPPAAVLPTCAAVVHDGDGALALAAVASGLPQLSLAESAFGRRVAGAGAGLVGAADGISRLVADDALRAGAAALGAEVAALPAPRAVVADLAR
ncbi:nucleotide disphospho-sugar-binding domain-containing protein [Amycolatopsis jiangsuensis]|uniref:UDP:flavonoid glycosyltransferase YjiC (YdhE family) n=1 Tax=Amycolatopsis jiangsuensis TaxID=1181879 RepID=A0A840J6K3_9PSEU|nr:nucleotide disphospho-sugar-binding domain-containing protein [Amycolatopsis jiangsuensis]MBB4689028.1 UDP:flavonoid glycosyltransferase YjiC (YdhE family) [Amycolatopsis jiangsuensis]